MLDHLQVASLFATESLKKGGEAVETSLDAARMSARATELI